MISISKYQVTFSVVVNNLTTWFNRFTWLIDFLKCLVKPIQDINDDFYSTISYIDDYLGYSGQHKVLETCLNDKFDTTGRGIFITENNAYGNQFNIYKESETLPIPTQIYKQYELSQNPLTIYTQAEGLVVNYDFTISVPVALTYDAYEFAGYVFRYVQTRTYNIITY